MSEALYRATQTITPSDLPRMVLYQRDLPVPYAIFSRHVTIPWTTRPWRSRFPWRHVGAFSRWERITGYMGEFAAPAPEGDEIPAGYDLLAATVVHLFDDPEGVSRWMDEIFVGEFCARVDQELHPGQRLLTVERLTPRGFADQAVGLRVLQSSEPGLCRRRSLISVSDGSWVWRMSQRSGTVNVWRWSSSSRTRWNGVSSRWLWRCASPPSTLARRPSTLREEYAHAIRLLHPH